MTSLRVLIVAKSTALPRPMTDLSCRMAGLVGPKPGVATRRGPKWPQHRWVVCFQVRDATATALGRIGAHATEHIAAMVELLQDGHQEVRYPFVCEWQY